MQLFIDVHWERRRYHPCSLVLAKQTDIDVEITSRRYSSTGCINGVDTQINRIFKRFLRCCHHCSVQTNAQKNKRFTTESLMLTNRVTGSKNHRMIKWKKNHWSCVKHGSRWRPVCCPDEIRERPVRKIIFRLLHLFGSFAVVFDDRRATSVGTNWYTDG